MADLSELQSTQGVKIAGTDTTGLETGWVASDSSGNLKVLDSANTQSDYSPNPISYQTPVPTAISVDYSGRLETHSTITSDEGSFRDDFSGTALTTALTGTLSFTNGSLTVTGTGTSFTTQAISGLFLKKTADAETLYVQIASVQSDTSLTLMTPYAGTTAAGVAAVVSKWKTTAGASGTFTVANSTLTITSGNTNVSSTFIQTVGDYLPYTLNVHASLSQRINNQASILGFADDIGTPTKGAYVSFTGTINTTVNFITQSSVAAADTQTTAVTIPSGGNTSTLNTYKIDVSANQATLLINGIVVATHQLHIPGPYDYLNIGARVTNVSNPNTSTSMVIDYIYFTNWDRIQIDNDFGGEPAAVTGNIFSGQADSGAPVKTGGVFNSTLPTLTTGQRGDMQLDSAGRLRVLSTPSSETRATYSATSAIAFASVANATDIFTITGSATKTVRILRIGFSATQTTAAAVNVLLVKRSTADTAGTSAAATRVPHDSADAAATATILNYTANPTLGTTVGTMKAVRAFIPTTALASSSQFYEFSFEDRPEKAPILRGIAEVLALNLNGVTVAGGAWTCFVEWLEE